MVQVIERDDIVEYEGEEWKVSWNPNPSNGLLELLQHTSSRYKRNTTAWATDVTLKSKATAVAM